MIKEHERGDGKKIPVTSHKYNKTNFDNSQC